MINALVGPDGQILQMTAAATRPAPRADTLHQMLERDSAAAVYVYTKSRLRTVDHRLSLRHLPQATVEAVLAFFRSSTRGTRHAFTWYDHAGQAFTLRLSSPKIEPQPAGGGRYHLTLDCQEELPL